MGVQLHVLVGNVGRGHVGSSAGKMFRSTSGSITIIVRKGYRKMKSSAASVYLDEM